jgi:hypothetical protein
VKVVKEKDLEDYVAAISLPPNLRRLGLGFLEKKQLEFVYPYADQLKELVGSLLCRSGYTRSL